MDSSVSKENSNFCGIQFVSMKRAMREIVVMSA